MSSSAIGTVHLFFHNFAIPQNRQKSSKLITQFLETALVQIRHVLIYPPFFIFPSLTTKIPGRQAPRAREGRGRARAVEISASGARLYFIVKSERENYMHCTCQARARAGGSLFMLFVGNSDNMAMRQPGVITCRLGPF